jgi:membrane protein YqaA with SNARE-associated domain
MRLRVVVAEHEVLRGVVGPGERTDQEGGGREPPFEANYNQGRRSGYRVQPLLKSFITWISGVATALGGPGLFVVAFLDSSFISLPQINDLLVVLMVLQDPAWMPYYAAMATLGSIAGCYAIYYIAERGGEAFARKRLKKDRVERALNLYRRHGLLALMIPAILPPPAPFKLFVLMAGVAKVRPVQFVVAIGIARGARYFALGYLTIKYGRAAEELMRTRGRDVALWLAAAIAAAVLVWWLVQRRNERREAAGG